MKKVMAVMREKCGVELWAGISVVTALLFMLCVYAPIELYCYNQQEFWFDVYDLLPLVIGMFLVGFVLASVVMCILCFACPRLYRLMLPLSSIVFLCTYVQGNFLVSNLPPMDGSYIDWNEYSDGRIHSIILWIVVMLVVCVTYRKLHMERFARAVRLVSLCMTLMLAVTGVSVFVSTEGYQAKLDACATNKNEYEFSENRNFIVLILDATDSGTVYELLEENPEYKEIFEDFTYYANTLGAYPCTQCAIPQILSGNWYENATSFEEYNVDAFQNATLLDILEQEGYKLGMYVYDTPYLDEGIFRFDNVLPRKSEVSSYVDFAKLEIKLVGLRYAPFDLKKLCVFSTNPFEDIRKTNEEYEPFYISNKLFYDRMNSSEISITEENCFKFIHIEGAHVPFQYDKDVNIIENGDYKQNVQASLTITKEYLEKLKKSGVYDNSVIVVMADHGLNGDDPLEFDGRQDPILFVKGVNEQHDMEISQAPISYVDLQEAFVRLVEGKDSGEIFDYKEGDERVRRYLYYEYLKEEHMYEYMHTGHASDNTGLVPSGKEYILE